MNIQLYVYHCIMYVFRSYHCRVPTTDELSNLVKDAFTVDRFVERAPLHDDRHCQKDLFTDIFL